MYVCHHFKRDMYVQFNRSDKVAYAKQNGGKYDFIIEKSSHKAVPIDQVGSIFIVCNTCLFHTHL